MEAVYTTTLTTEDGRALTGRLYYDDNPPHPRKDWDPATRMILFRRGEPWKEIEDHNLHTKDFANREELLEAIEGDNPNAFVFPVRIYQHSGTSFSLSHEYPYDCPWDSGEAGFVVVPFENAHDEADARELAEAELRELTAYANGECYWYEVREGTDTCDKCSPVLDTCGGFIGLGWAKENLADTTNALATVREEVPA